MPWKSQQEKKAFLKLVTWTMGLILLITGINALFVINLVGTPFLKPIQRNVASMERVQKKLKDGIVSPVIEVNCKKKLKTIKLQTKAPNTRIAFKNCKNVEHLENESNKNQGDVFALSHGVWTSDFIILDPGENRIKAVLPKGTQAINITREIIKKTPQEKAL